MRRNECKKKHSVCGDGEWYLIHWLPISVDDGPGPEFGICLTRLANGRLRLEFDAEVKNGFKWNIWNSAYAMLSGGS